MKNKNLNGVNGRCTQLQILSLTVVAAVAVMITGAGPAQALPINWDGKAAMPSIAARDMPLQDFMQALVAPQGLAVVVSPVASQTTVNGRFSGNPGKAFNSVISTSTLLPYFDGSTLYVFAGSEVQRKTIALSPASTERVIATLSKLQLHDGRYNTFTAVPASGLLRLSGTKPFVDQMQEIVRSVQMTGSSSPEQLSVYPLKYAFAWDVTIPSAGKQVVVPGIATLLRNLLGLNGPPANTASRTRSSVPKLRGKGMASGNDTDALNAPDTTGTEDMAEASARYGNAGSGPMVAAEVRTNSVVVRDTPDRMARYAELIKALDIEPVMVEFETTIVDINTDRLQELGVNWRLAGSRNEARLGRGDSSDLQLRGPTVGDVTPIGRGLNWSTILDSGRLIARITALAVDGNARVVSRAQVSTMANIESTISSNQTSYVRVGGFQEVDLFPITAVTSVRVTPQVFSRGDRQIVSMNVNIRDGRFTDAVVDNIPSVKEVSLSTNGLVPENQTFVIGGFSQDSSSKRTDKVPLLGDLPVVGGIFRTTTDQAVKAERLFLVTPRVITVSKLLARPIEPPPVAGGPASFIGGVGGSARSTGRFGANERGHQFEGN